MAERFAGQESKLALYNSTTQDPILPDIAVNSMNVSLKNEWENYIATKVASGEFTFVAIGEDGKSRAVASE